jgi:hypothetical protein
MNTPPTSPRGTVLLLVSVLLLVITVLALAAIGFSNSERTASSGFRSSEELAACAETGRQYLLSRFRLFGQAPTQLSATDVRLDQPGLPACEESDGTLPKDPDVRCIRSGHIGQVDVVGVRSLSRTALGNTKNAFDLTNRIAPASSLGGQTYHVVVHCRDGRGAESEVEFTLRFGL